jgi:ribokinase
MTRIVVVGSSNTDMVITTPHLPETGETVLGSDFVMAPGGKGANQAVAARRLGGEVALVARLGQDLLGDEALSHFQKEGIDTRYVFRDPQAPSGVALIMVGDGGENIIAVAAGANGCLAVEDIDKARSIFEDTRVTLLQLEIPIPAVEEAVRVAKAAHSQVILNPAPAQPLPAGLLAQVDILTPNENEAMALSGCRDREDGVRELLQKGVGRVIVTLGAAGVLMGEPGCSIHYFPGFSVKAVDTTAAGDAFNGGLAVALARGDPIEKAIGYAQAAAALSVTKRGAQPSLPAAGEVRQFLQQYKG